MATYTRDEFVRRVLVELGVLDAEEAPEAVDAVSVGDVTQQKFEELYEEGLIPWDIDGDIPGRYFLPLLSIVVAECMTSYRKTANVAILAPKAAAGNAQLWKFRERAYFPIPTQADYF